MNRYLFQLCFDYVKCYSAIELLISVDGIDAERLKLFRLMQNRCKQLEQEMEQCIVENEFVKIIVNNEVKK